MTCQIPVWADPTVAIVGSPARFHREVAQAFARWEPFAQRSRSLLASRLCVDHPGRAGSRSLPAEGIAAIKLVRKIE